MKQQNEPANEIPVGDHVRISFLTGADGEFLGLGEVRIGGVRLRDGKFPMLPRLDTPDGHAYTGMKLDRIERGKKGSALIVLSLTGVPLGRQEYLDEYNQPMVALGQPRTMVTDRLDIRLAPARLSLGGREWRGFSWSFEFRSAKRRIHRILVDGSWEIGGSIVGNTVLSQGQVNRPAWVGSKKAVFTTACLKSITRHGSPQGVSYQLGPRGALIQPFDFQFNKQGALLQYWPDPDAMSSVLESPKGSTRLLVSDEYRFALARRAVTPAQHVLFMPGPLAEHEGRDLWWEAREFVHGSMRAAIGLDATLARPQMGMRYTSHFVKNTAILKFEDREVASHEVPYYLADHVLPRLAQQGIRCFMPEPMSESDATVCGLRRKLDGGIHGDLHCASVCATHRYLPSEFWGGMKAWKYLARRAREQGILLGCFFEPNLSPRAAILAEHPEYVMASNNSLPWSGGFGIQTLVTLDWNSGVFDWMLDDLNRWHAEGGFDILSVCDAANFGLLGRNYAAGMRNNFDALQRLYGELGRAGIRDFVFEGVSPFGAGHFGAADIRPPEFPGEGQNNFDWWVGHEDMACDSHIGCWPQGRSDEELRRICFRFMANRGIFTAASLIGGRYRLPDWWRALNFVYERALPHMKTRRLLPGGAGVLWTDGDARVLWTYRETALPSDRGSQATEIRERGLRPVPFRGGRAVLPAYGVYLIPGAGDMLRMVRPR